MCICSAKRDDQVKEIDAGFVKYNANDNQKNVGDCVARSISFATGQDYTTTLHSLQQLARNLGYGSYRNTRVFKAMMNSLGLRENKIADLEVDVSSFCEDHPEGTYLLLVGKKAGETSHAVCISNGDVYDSWDSQSQMITSYWQVSSSGNKINITLEDVNNLKADLDPVISKVVVQASKKMPYAEIYYNFVDSKQVDYGVRFTLFCSTKFDDPKMFLYSNSQRKYVVAKLNPLRYYQDQKEQVVERARVQVREWLYSIRKEIEDAQKWYDASINKNFVGSRSLLSKLPKDFQPYVTDIHNYGYEHYSISFEDYHSDDPENELQGSFETWNELLKAVKEYVKNGYWEYYY